MKVLQTPLPGVLLIEPRVHGDDRGYFYESYNERDFKAHAGVDARFVQDNHSRSARGVLRGLHYQIGQPQGKLVRATVGAVYDVVVDVRRSSPHLGRHYACVLSADNKRMLWVPAGYAHGFYVTTAHAEFQYKTTDYWAPECERVIAWNDPALGIVWPLQGDPLVSAKDRDAPRLHDAELFP